MSPGLSAITDARNGRSTRAPQHLAFVTSTPLNVASGSGTFVGIRELARFLEARQVRVTPYVPTFWSPSFTLKRLLFNLGIVDRLRRGRHDWVVGFDLDGFHYGRRPVAPYIASLKGVIADELRNERGVVRLMLGVQASLERLAVRRAAVVVATSRYSRERIVEAYGILPTKIVVVPELIDLAIWKTEWGAEPVSEAGHPAVLTVAHMYPRKNLAILLRAYALLVKDGVPFRGWIVGEGPCRRRWERLRDSLGLRDRVEFLGTIPRRELVNRYRRASVFCLPSRQEGFGIVFLEAMANARPIVAARAAAVPETVADGEVGLLADPDDPGEMARHLSVLLTNPELRLAMGQAGRRRVEEYRADRVAEMFLTRIQAVLASDGRPEGDALRGEAEVAIRGSEKTTGRQG